MLRAIGATGFEDLLAGVPQHLRLKEPLGLPPGLSEMEVRSRLEGLAARNRGAGHLVCFAGLGVYDHYIPAAIDGLVSRSEFTTAYTPYQPEVSQGTLQVIYEFQSLVAELMGMDVANASLYDGGHALAEAVLLAEAARGVPRVLYSEGINPHFLRVVRTYASGLGVKLVAVPLGADGRTDPAALKAALAKPASAFLLAQPNFYGVVEDGAALTALVKDAGGPKAPLVVAAVYPTALGLLAPPGSWGADVAVGEGQSLGLPMSLGGPGLGLFACRAEHLRRMPGRLIGRTLDRDGREAYVLTLQTREQHIRRAKATSNICTNQGLMATWATVYMTLIGPQGLKEVAEQSAQKAHYLADRLTRIPGVRPAFPGSPFLNEFTLELDRKSAPVLKKLARTGFLGGIDPSRFGRGIRKGLVVAVTERRTRAQLDAFAEAFTRAMA
jgi:glycine dehydrogenase subunit 1